MSSNIEDDNMQHYVNIKFHSDEARPALPPRPDRRSEVTALGNEYERIKEREEDLERIHRRSRELIRGQYEEGEGQNMNTFRPARHVFIR